ncbi:MAG: photosynthetic reaction center subunit H, partial [Pseudomonadota bacterium]
MTNNIVGSIDLVEFIFTLFWLFFAVLVFYLHRESKREGYPLEAPHRMGEVV